MAKCGYVTLNVHLWDYFGGECGRGIWETICFFWHCQRNCRNHLALFCNFMFYFWCLHSKRTLWFLTMNIHPYILVLTAPHSSSPHQTPTHTHTVLLLRIIILYVDEFIVPSFSCSVKCIRVWMAKGIAILCWVVLVGYLLYSTNERVKGGKRLNELYDWRNEWVNE